jgi:transcription elongation factor Elf1
MSVRVSKKDFVCPECGGQVTAVDCDDATIDIECDDCGNFMTVEPDGLHDGGVIYWPQLMVQKERGEL